MSYSAVPSTWLGAGYSYAANQILLNTAAHGTPLLTELTAAEADATTGDIRKIMYALAQMLYTKYTAIATADRPTRMAIYRGSTLDESTNLVTRTFTLTFTLDASAIDVTAE